MVVELFVETSRSVIGYWLLENGYWEMENSGNGSWLIGKVEKLT